MAGCLGEGAWMAGWKALVCCAPACPVPHAPDHRPCRRLPEPLLQEGQAPFGWFLAVSISTGIGAIFIFTGVMCFCRWKRLI